MLQVNNITTNYESQVKKILTKAKAKKMLNAEVVSWLMSRNDDELYRRAYNISDCASYIGVTNINGVAKIIKANFCRDRLCHVCAWRRQSKFMAQMFPVLEILGKKYDFLLVTLTIQSVSLDNLKKSIDLILQSYDRLLKHRRIQRAWVGKVRGLEMKYNEKAKTFNPHIHVLVAVEKDYFTNSDKYISHKMLVEYWHESLGKTYTSVYKPRVEIKKVTSADKGAIETLKYSFKQMRDNTAMLGFVIALKNRRLISFSGVFAKTRKLLQFSDFENILTDDLPDVKPKNILYTLYEFDATGGVYNYYKQLEFSI